VTGFPKKMFQTKFRKFQTKKKFRISKTSNWLGEITLLRDPLFHFNNTDKMRRAGHAEPHKISPSSNLAKPKKKKSDAPPPKKTRSKKHKRVNNVRNSISICFVWFDV